MQSKTVSHQYDPRIVFHSYSSNVPHLQSWIDDLIQLTENSLPVSSTPTTDLLVQALQRYDAVYKELLRQTSIFSEPLTQMLSQAWAGVLKLMTYMIKSYNRYVKQTSHLQNQAQTLLNERQRGDAANKIQKEEFELERTALRARVRTVESELEALQSTKRMLENENTKLRKIMDTYIRSTDVNDDYLMANMKYEQTVRSTLTKGNADDADEDEPKHSLPTTEQQQLGFKRKDLLDAGRFQLKNLNRLDIEMNDIIVNVSKEENRQRLLMKDLMQFIQKHNTEIFSKLNNPFSSDSVAAVGEAVKNNMRSSFDSVNGSPTNKRKKKLSVSINSPKPDNDSMGAMLVLTKQDMGVQVDMKDELNMKLEIAEDKQPAVDILTLGVAPLAPSNAVILGLDYPYQVRKLMTSFPQVLRVPTIAWTCQHILSIYLDKLQIDLDRRALGLPPLTMPAQTYDYFYRYLGIKVCADSHVALLMRACESHSSKSPRISLFSSQLGLLNKEEFPPLDVRDTQFILDVVLSLIRQGELQSDLNHKLVGKNHKKISSTPSAQSGKERDFGGTAAVVATQIAASHIRPDILRNNAVNTVHEILGKWLPDGGEDYITRIRTMQHSELGQRYVNVDVVLDLLLEPWHTVRMNWEEHGKFLFRKFCKVYRVLQEATFANDDGVLGSDSLLAELDKRHAAENTRRPLRMFQMNMDENNEERDGNNANPTTVQPTAAGGHHNNASAREPVVEMMSRKNFLDCLHAIIPSLTEKQIDSMFDEALDLAYEQVTRSLELLWRRYIDEAANYVVQARDGSSSSLHHNSVTGFRHGHRVLGTNREFWVNTKTNISQWTRPYHSRMFRIQDIEVDTFVQILIHKDIFPHSPLLEFFNLSPKDLWPNADMFYKQIMDRKK